MDPSRRLFIKESASAVAAVGLAPALQAAVPSEKIVVGQIGCGNRSKTLIGGLQSLKNVELAYVCDPDADRRNAAVKRAGKAKPVGDFRTILDDNSVDAVMIATPDHWHAPAALLAMVRDKRSELVVVPSFMNPTQG